MAAEIKITISSTASGGAIQQATKDVEDLGKTAKDAGGGFSALREIGVGALREIGSIAVNALGSAAGAVKDFISDGISAARETAKLNAQTDAVLKSTGNAAGTSAKHIADYASALSAAAGKSLFGDDQIQQSENMLLTFTNIRGKVLDAATAISVDMAQALGGAPKDNAIQLGKALNDPIKGVTALTRVGVTFTQDQKDMIQAMVETGDVAGAQGVILAELNKEFGGSAEAAAKADGGMAQFRDRMGEAAEALGTALLPLIGKLAGFLNDTVAPAVEATVSRIGNLIAAFQTGAEGGDFLGGLTNALYSLNDVSPVFDTIADGILSIAQSYDEGGVGGALNDFFYQLTGIQGIGFAITDTFNAIVGAFQPLIATFTDARTPVEGFINVLSEISPTFALLVNVAQQILPQLLAVVQQIFGDIVAFVQQHGQEIIDSALHTWQTIRSTIDALVPPIVAIVSAVLTQISNLWHAHGEDIMAILKKAWDTIILIVNTALELYKAIVPPILNAIAKFITDNGAQIQAIIGNVWTVIKSIIDIALTLIQGIIQTALQIMHGDFEGAYQTLQAMNQQVWDDIKAIIQAVWNTIVILLTGVWNDIKTKAEGAWNAIKGVLEGVAHSIVDTISALPDKLSGVGSDIINGIVNGIENEAGRLFDTLRNIANDALKAAKDAILSGSPSRLFAEQVGAPMAQGMAVGLAGNAPLVMEAARYTAQSAARASAGVANTYRNFTINYNGLTNAPNMDYATSMALGGIG